MELFEDDPETQRTLLSQHTLQVLCKSIVLYFSLFLKMNSKFLISLKREELVNELFLVEQRSDWLGIGSDYVLDDLTI